ncbi:MAG: glycoside hydrolase family 99-like domain-containing protein [Paludibacteraceae bacterium]|nr:glycoside hydrolase family 99-like domain-containing protein [Paludibacteraceae bacterium]
MRIIAYYLPQFHPIPENDEWWGKNYTEWVSVRQAQPLFAGHQQPVVPGELGYYNLLNSDVRERQAQLAREAGIEGFCYWHYWFGGKQLLEKPLQQVVQSGKPDFPFCIGWANESWKAKTWLDQQNAPDKLLIEQTYSEEDDKAHFAAILPILRDKRYIHVNGKPLLMVYRPLQLPDGAEWVTRWQRMAREAGLGGLHLLGHALYEREIEAVKALGFDAVNLVPIGDVKRFPYLVLRHLPTLVRYLMGRSPLVYDYRQAMRVFASPIMRHEEVVPTILPNWDHSPRSKMRAFILHHSTPEAFRAHTEQIKRIVANKRNELVMLKSWNEWGEGNYMEPDARWGRQYIDSLREAIKE